MSRKSSATPTPGELATQPFFYEIRVRGHLSKDQWAEWFDDLTLITSGGETTLRGVLPDHAALYGLLGRLRDLAIPLLAVNVLDGEARRKISLHSRRYELVINLTILAIYLILAGGLATITVFLTNDAGVDTALALAGLFAVVGGLAYAFSLWSGIKQWRWLAYAMWPASVLVFLIFTATSRILPPAISIALILFLGGGGLIYLVLYLQGRASRINAPIVGWRALGRFDDTARPGGTVETDRTQQDR